MVVTKVAGDGSIRRGVLDTGKWQGKLYLLVGKLGPQVLFYNVRKFQEVGLPLPKDQADFGDAIASAVKALIADGSYQKILNKWGVTAGAIANPAVNPSA